MMLYKEIPQSLLREVGSGWLTAFGVWKPVPLVEQSEPSGRFDQNERALRSKHR